MSVRVRKCGLCRQPVAQGAEVVDLAVEDADGPVLVGDRLVAARDVDDAEAGGAERDARVVVGIEAGVVRAAMPEQGQHRRRPALGVGARRPCDAAHRQRRPCSQATTNPAVSQMRGETA